MGCCPGSEGKKKYATNEEIIEALRKTMGNKTRAAKLLGYSSPSSLYQRLSLDPELKKAVQDVVEERCDYLEDKLQEHIDNGNLDALKTALAAVAKKRGYGVNNLDMAVDNRHQVHFDPSFLASLVDKFEEKLQVTDQSSDEVIDIGDLADKTREEVE